MVMDAAEGMSKGKEETSEEVVLRVEGRLDSLDNLLDNLLGVSKEEQNSPPIEAGTRACLRRCDAKSQQLVSRLHEIVEITGKL